MLGSSDVQNPDPRFPDRPQHPDFWALSKCAIKNDELADDKQALSTIIEDFCDMDSLKYIVKQRILRMRSYFPDMTDKDCDRAYAIYLDAFTLGARFERSRTNYGAGKQ